METFLARYVSASLGLHLAVARRDGTLVRVNAALAGSLKIPAERILGRPLWERLPASDAELLRGRLARGASPEGPFLLNFVDAEQAPFTLRCQLDVRPEEFTLVGEAPQRELAATQEELLRLNNELTALHRECARKNRALEEALAERTRAQALLVHREKMAILGQMTAGVAHQINNPLAFLLSNQATLRDEFDGLVALARVVAEVLPALERAAPDAHAHLAQAAGRADVAYLAERIPHKLADSVKGLERVEELVRDLQTFARVDEAAFKRCDLAAGIRSTLRFLAPLVHEQGVSVEDDLEEPLDVYCWPGALQQALASVVTNAVQASTRGQSVRVSARRLPGVVVIRVDDQGAGIAPEHRPRVFEPFFTTKAEGAGTGLGLTIAHEVLLRHHGTIELDSAPGRGTSVLLRVPLLAADGKPATPDGGRA